MVRTRVDKRARALTWLRSQNCEAPKVAFTVFSQFLYIFPGRAQPTDALYVLLLVCTHCSLSVRYFPGTDILVSDRTFFTYYGLLFPVVTLSLV